MGLLKKKNKSTAIPKNMEAKREKAAKARIAFEEAEVLKVKLREAIEEKGFDIAKMFKIFDTNGDGNFD